MDTFFLSCPKESNTKIHRASKVLILGNLKMILTTGTSCWNVRQIALWKQVGLPMQDRYTAMLPDNNGRLIGVHQNILFN